MNNLLKSAVAQQLRISKDIVKKLTMPRQSVGAHLFRLGLAGNNPYIRCLSAHSEALSKKIYQKISKSHDFR